MSIRKMRAAGARVREAARWQAMIVRLLIQIEDIDTRTKKRIERINEKKNSRIENLKRRVSEYAAKVLGYFEDERAKREEPPRTISTHAGKCEWYPGVDSIDDFDSEAAIAELRKRGIEDALRPKIELNKEYLLEHPELVEEIPGIRIIKRPKRVLRFEDSDARVELTKGSDLWTIVFPREKK